MIPSDLGLIPRNHAPAGTSAIIQKRWGGRPNLSQVTDDTQATISHELPKNIIHAFRFAHRRAGWIESKPVRGDRVVMSGMTIRVIRGSYRSLTAPVVNGVAGTNRVTTFTPTVVRQQPLERGTVLVYKHPPATAGGIRRDA